jgi:aspartyl-tRNA(Asn)/glutamyl-tRNA(Gln) amidotransferase subunit B
MEYEPVIGLEVHVQLMTESKMFTRAPYLYGAVANSLTNPVVMGLPGVLPVMNRLAIEKTIITGLLFGCKIADTCKWDRKNYFYPDSPKNYQISQYDQPLCLGGRVEIELPGASRNVMGKHRMVSLTRIHLEEDVGKLSHIQNDTLVDYNRAGVPLMEIVSSPDLFNSEEVAAFLNSLRQSLIYAGISDCDMEKGQMRCDTNISVKPVGQKKLGTRTEIKNLNSISAVKACIDFEIKRQTEKVRKGDRIIQETRRWDVEGKFTTSMREKEDEHDYRYFPDPDLMPVRVSKEMIERLQKEVPELPFEKQRRFMQDYKLPYTITSALCPNKTLCDYFEEALKVYHKPQQIANFIVNDLLRELSSANTQKPLSLTECKIKPEHIAQLVELVDKGIISQQGAKEVFLEVFATGQAPEIIVDRKDLRQSSEIGPIKEICSQVIANNPKPVAAFKNGRESALNVLKGQVIKATRGKANPKVIDVCLRELIQNSPHQP